MYVRKNNGKPSYSDAVSDSEYEFYRYNIPPMYNGNSFVDLSGNIADEGTTVVTEDYTVEDADIQTDVTEEQDMCVKVQPESGRENGILWLPQIGKEELLILGIIFLLASGGCEDDSVLILSVILLAGL